MNLTKEILPPNQVPQRSFGFDFSDIVADYLSQFNDSEEEAIGYLQRKLIDPDFVLFKQNYDKVLEIWSQKEGDGYWKFLTELKKKYVDNTPEISGYKGTVKSEDMEDWVRDNIIEAGDDD